jgi:hypothetical protein
MPFPIFRHHQRGVDKQDDLGEIRRAALPFGHRRNASETGILTDNGRALPVTYCDGSNQVYRNKGDRGAFARLRV